MNFEDPEDETLVYKNPELRAQIEELNSIVMCNLPDVHIDESDTSDEPVRRVTEAEMRASCTSLFSNSNSTASNSREHKPEKKEDEKNEEFFQVPANLDEILDAELGTNFCKKSQKTGEIQNENGHQENGNSDDTTKSGHSKLKPDSELNNEECSAAQGDGHQFELNREDITFAEITKLVSVSCGEYLNPITGEGIVLEEGDCGIRKLATASGSRPEMSDSAWKRASASTSNCGRPATVPKARARRSETTSVMTNTEQPRDLIAGQMKNNLQKEEDESDDSDDNTWWEDNGKGVAAGCPIPKRRTLLDNGPNVDITRQRSILDLCSVQHGETVDNIDSKDPEFKCEEDLLENTEATAGKVVGDNDKKGAVPAEASGDAIPPIFEEDAHLLENEEIEAMKNEPWSWANTIPRSCYVEEIDCEESYLPTLRDDDIDLRLLQQELQVTRNEYK